MVPIVKSPNVKFEVVPLPTTNTTKQVTQALEPEEGGAETVLSEFRRDEYTFDYKVTDPICMDELDTNTQEYTTTQELK